MHCIILGEVEMFIRRIKRCIGIQNGESSFFHVMIMCALRHKGVATAIETNDKISRTYLVALRS